MCIRDRLYIVKGNKKKVTFVDEKAIQNNLFFTTPYLECPFDNIDIIHMIFDSQINLFQMPNINNI